MRRPLSVEGLEQRWLLAGDLTALWIADDLALAVADGAPLTAWSDAIGGISATSDGAPELISDPASGRALVRFDGTDGADSFLISSRVNPLSQANDFSAVVVFRTEFSAFEGGDQRWFENTGLFDANQLGLGRDWGLSINAMGQLATGMSGGLTSPPQTLYSNATGLNDGQLHIAIVTRAGSSLTLQVDDQPAVVRDDLANTARSNLNARIGALANNTLPFTGDIAQVRLYDGALTSSETGALRAEIDAYYQNVAPMAIDDTYDLVEDAAIFVRGASQGVLANDIDADGDQLTATLVQPPTIGTLNLATDGSFVYSTRRDFYGTVTFSYVANDHRPSEVATVRLNLAPAYDPPVPTADAYKIRPDQTLNIFGLVGLLANDKNPDGAALTASIARPVNEGLLTLSSDGGFSYDPNGFEGIATFAYQIDDGTRITGPVPVTIAVNSPPTAVNDTYEIGEDERLAVTAASGVLSNDTDPQANARLVATLLSPPTNGSLEFGEDGSFVYAPNTEYSGPDSFSYRTSDGIDDSNMAVVTLQVTNIDDPPVAVADAFFSLPGQPLEVPAAAGLLANDTDAEQQQLAARLATQPTSGTVALQADGGFTYRPNAGFVGRDSFTYVATDATSNSQAATVVIEIAAQPLIISEIMAVNSATLPTRSRELESDRFLGDEVFHDWIEIQNLLDVDLAVGGAHLTDDPTDPTKWQFPAGTVIPAGAYLVVFASGQNTLDPTLDQQGMVHTNFRLSSEGEYLALTTRHGVVVDALQPTYPEQYANVSFGRVDQQLAYFATATPGAANKDARISRTNEVDVSVGHGFYNAPIEVSLSAGEPNARIRYTLDGSAPSESSGNDYRMPIRVASTTTLRVIAIGENLLPSKITTHSYLFLDDIITQSRDGAAPAGWPTAPVKGQVFDYGMDPAIVNDPAWNSQLKDALTQIPSISVVLQLADLTGSDDGIYVNASRDGRAWERPASIELVDPQGGLNFQIDAGLRIRGGFSRGSFNPKHSFRLFFRDEYEGPLNVPLFGDEGADQFRAIDLRTAQNYAWSNDTFNDQTRNSFLRDIYSRDLQNALGQPYTRGRYYHLYLNGQYWGLYQTEERPEASFAETYLGASADDYDVVKASGGVLVATDGTLDRWNDLWAIANRGFASLDEYFLIQGKNPDGSDNKDLEVHVQIDNVIDFAINFMFTGNQDMPTSLGNNVANNFWAIRNPNSRDGWQFVAHDSEHNMLAVDNDQTQDDSAGNTRASFNPKYLHQQLDALPEYRLRFADRVQKFFFNDGPLTRENARALMDARVEQIDQAIIAESARWGDQHNEPPLNKNTWLAEVDWLLNQFLENRSEIVLNQFRSRGLYPDVAPVMLNQHGGQVEFGFALDLTAPAGTIYYRLDGQDPREVGGAISAQAVPWQRDVAVRLTRDTRLLARVWTGSGWSALTETQFIVGDAVVPTALRVSEIQYHPTAPSAAELAAGFTNDDDFEYIELINPSNETLDLTRASLARIQQGNNQSGVEFDFATGSVQRLGPGERVVIVEDRAAFEFRYGSDVLVAGQWSGGLSNAGETLTLQVDRAVLHQFVYDDGWYPSTDGTGRSLEIVNAASADLASWSTAAGWRASPTPGGSPGSVSRVPGDSNGDGVFDSSDLVFVFQIGEYEDAIAKNSTFEDGDWNGDGDFTTSDLVFVFQQGLSAE